MYPLQERIKKACEDLGLDPMQVTSLNITPHKITATVILKDDSGQDAYDCEFPDEEAA